MRSVLSTGQHPRNWWQKRRPRVQIDVELLVAWLKPLNTTLTVAKAQK